MDAEPSALFVYRSIYKEGLSLSEIFHLCGGDQGGDEQRDDGIGKAVHRYE